MIYFLEDLASGIVKIGRTDRDVEARCLEHERRYCRPLRLVATMPGGKDQEDWIKLEFAHLKLEPSEQYRPGPELARFIEDRGVYQSPLPFLTELQGVFWSGVDPESVEMIDWLVEVKVWRSFAVKLKAVAAHRRVRTADLLAEYAGFAVDRDHRRLLKNRRLGRRSG